jgi:hypothetical protein
VLTLRANSNRVIKDTWEVLNCGVCCYYANVVAIHVFHCKVFVVYVSTVSESKKKAGLLSTSL